jgi:hypothetical protein
MASLEFDSRPGPQGQIALTEITAPAEEFSGIYWEQVGLLKVPMEIQRAINLDIAEQRRRLMGTHNIPHSDVMLIQDLDGIPEDAAELLTADVILDDKSFPNGLIRIFPSHVKIVVAEKMRGNQEPSLTLIGDMGHENFHRWQKKNMKEALERDLRLTAGRSNFIERFSVWSTCPSEVMAREYERVWIEHWMDYPETAK